MAEENKKERDYPLKGINKEVEWQIRKIVSSSLNHPSFGSIYPFDVSITVNEDTRKNLANIVVSGKLKIDKPEDYIENTEDELKLLFAFFEGKHFTKFKEVIKRGDEIAEKIRSGLYKKICEEHELCKHLRKLNNSEIDAAKEVYGILIATAGGSLIIHPGIPIALASVYLTKYGLEKYCKCKKLTRPKQIDGKDCKCCKCKNCDKNHNHWTHD